MEELNRALHESTIDELLYVCGVNPIDMIPYLSDNDEENKKLIDDISKILFTYIKNNVNDKLGIYKDGFGYYHLIRKDNQNELL